MSQELAPFPRPFTKVDRVAGALLDTAQTTEVHDVFARFEVEDPADLHIELGRKFFDLFPRIGEPLPEEDYYADIGRREPVVFSGLPAEVYISVLKEDHRPQDSPYYELSADFDYLNDSDELFYRFSLVKSSDEPGIYRRFYVPANDDAQDDDTTPYGSQGFENSTETDSENEFANLIELHAGNEIIEIIE